MHVRIDLASKPIFIERCIFWDCGKALYVFIIEFYRTIMSQSVGILLLSIWFGRWRYSLVSSYHERSCVISAYVAIAYCRTTFSSTSTYISLTFWTSLLRTSFPFLKDHWFFSSWPGFVGWSFLRCSILGVSLWMWNGCFGMLRRPLLIALKYLS